MQLGNDHGNLYSSKFSFFIKIFKILFIWEQEREKEHEWGEWQGEKQTPC